MYNEYIKAAKSVKRSVLMKNIKQLRIERNLSSAQMAKELGMPPSTYSDKERGRRKFQPMEIVQICQMFKVRVEEVKNFYKKDCLNSESQTTS